ncbi:MAG: uroporphyrinogen decarboxylase [Candidatus Omnitrophota bacterium]|nr:uroporphyrinogen decarboxylase [Candidatus Omnitrophota bacterium]MDZ4243175.1 uroporphyrinogen decarboxylase [Candidatus Omnitrophota bacterium]
MTTPLLLQAFQGTNTEIPVWFMRQAGRYLPSYQAIRKNHTLEEMFADPQTASEVTCLPVRELDVDAAILFADILTLPSLMGFRIRFSKEIGPVIANPIARPSDVARMQTAEKFSGIQEAITLTLKKLPASIPLIGFAGAPFTVLCYLIEGGSSISFRKTLAFAHQHPKEFHRALSALTDNTICYLKAQQEAGIAVFQLFDSWGGILRDKEYRQWVLPYVQRIFKTLRLPSIYYLKNCHHLIPEMVRSGAGMLSVCETVDLAKCPALLKSGKGVQGNLCNTLLYADDRTLAKEVRLLLKAASGYKKYIFNLSHGVFPDVKVDKLRLVIREIRKFRKP